MSPLACRTPTSQVLADLHRFGPTRCDTLGGADAEQYTRRLTQRGDENFHVLTLLLPRRLRTDAANLYAFCRWADDLSDETGDRSQALALLAWWRDELHRCFDGRPRHPVFVALRGTITRHDLPREPFDALLDAFEQDQHQSAYATWDELLDYCRRSANPVGRLYLMICGHRDTCRFALSDQTCTALQLVNFWQDVRRDLLDRDRVYIPADVAATHGLDLGALRRAIRDDAAPTATNTRGLDRAYRSTLQDLAGRTRTRFDEGRSLLPLLPGDVRAPVRLFTLGGAAVLRKIVRADYATHRRRPRLGRLAKAALLGRAWLLRRSSLV